MKGPKQIINRAVDAFRRDWQQFFTNPEAANRPRIENTLQGIERELARPLTDAELREAFSLLLDAEIDVHVRAGMSQAAVGEDVARFPQFGPEIDAALNPQKPEANAEGGAAASCWQPTPNAKIGEFCLIEEIGRGGMGAVWLAEHAGSGKRVAIKFPFFAVYTMDGLRCFRREAEVLANLSVEHSRHIVRLLWEHTQVPKVPDGMSWAELQSRLLAEPPHLVMEYVPGGKTLKDLLGGEQLRPERVAEIMLAVCMAVCHAHREGIFHRDLKPANVLIDPDGQPKISDFGFAVLRDEQRLSHTGGTRNYMSPEQLRGEKDITAPPTFGPWA